MITLAEQLRQHATVLSSPRPGSIVNAALANALMHYASQLDARAALIVAADPDQLEAVALTLGDPEMASLGEHSVECAEYGCRKGDAVNCPFTVCECWTYPPENRQTGHHPDCSFWNAHAAVGE